MRALVFFLIIAGCSTSSPTPYQKEKKKEGYRDRNLDELKVVTFSANSSTKKDRVQLYAQFRAIENCRSDDKKHADIIDIFDQTVEKNITRSSGSGWAPYFGTYPYYSRYSSIGISGSFGALSSDTWNETLVFPIVEIYYRCSHSVVRPQLIFRELNADQMEHLVKDIKGAIQVEKIENNSPNRQTIELGDIILKAQGKRIEKVHEFIRLFKNKDSEVSVLFLREGKRVIGKLKAIDITDEVKKSEEDIIKQVCSFKLDKKQHTLTKKNICNGIN